MREADQLIAGALRDIAAEAGLSGTVPAAGAAWRAGRRRRMARLTVSAASIAGVIALTLTVVLPLTAVQHGPASPAEPSGGSVSITLTAARPASPAELAAAARILTKRAAYLHLPGTRARVAGQHVVLTGPKPDQAQLKALTADGVLNFRQVLLYQPHGSRAYGVASLVNHNTLALFGKLVCRPGTTSTSPDDPRAQVVSCDSIGGKYALDVAKVRGTQITRAVAQRSTTGFGWDIAVTFNRQGATALASLSTQMYAKSISDDADRNLDYYYLDTIAVTLDGNVITAPHIDGSIHDGLAQISGDFTQAQTEMLAAQLQSGPLPVHFRISSLGTPNP